MIKLLLLSVLLVGCNTTTSTENSVVSTEPELTVHREGILADKIYDAVYESDFGSDEIKSCAIVSSIYRLELGCSSATFKATILIERR